MRSKNNVMTHLVIGFPDLQTAEKILEVMISCGVTRIELQIPFSDTLADGPVIMKANDVAIDRGVTTQKCLEFVNKQYKRFPDVDFYLMTYYQKIFSFGTSRFIALSAKAGVKGLIVPDFPFDCQEAMDFSEHLETKRLEFVPVISSGMADSRIKGLLSYADYSFVYLTARHGVTGLKTRRISALLPEVQRVRELSSKEIGIGFGISTLADVQAANKTADFAVIGSRLLTAFHRDGLKELDDYLRNIMQ